LHLYEHEKLISKDGSSSKILKSLKCAIYLTSASVIVCIFFNRLSLIYTTSLGQQGTKDSPIRIWPLWMIGKGFMLIRNEHTRIKVQAKD